MAKYRFSAGVGKGARTSRMGGSVDALSKQAIRDFRGIVANYQKFLDHVHGVAPELMLNALKPTFELAKKYTPKDTHELVNSGYLEVTQRGRTPRIEMGFARNGRPYYAVIVHEKMEHKHARPTRAKFLQAAMQEDVGKMRQRLIVQFSQITGSTGSGGVQ